jgi:hypothetical protein
MSDSVAAKFAIAFEALSAIATDGAVYDQHSDESLLNLNDLCASVQRVANTHAALIAGSVARRSAPELGHNGLAQRGGYRTPEELIRSTTGSTGVEAARAVRAGKLANGDDPREWLQPVGAALADSQLSVAAADAISSGLGSPTSLISASELAAAAVQLCDEAASLDADRLLRRARELRDELDDAGVGDREAARREQRSLTFVRRVDGMSRLTWQMDPETAALVGEIYDRATSPKLGGPRFVQADATELFDRIDKDPRKPDQLASDVFAELLRQGADADSRQLLGTGAPSIRVLVTDTALRVRAGHGFIEGQADPVSIQTVERLACSGGVMITVFDEDGQPLDVGREQRLFTRRQRVALAARDGGCRWPGCERPPSWTEAHHVKHWARDGGRTDVADGILLCKHHHLLMHNNHWEIERKGGEYWLTPPPDVDPLQRPRLMPSRSRVLKELMKELMQELVVGPMETEQAEVQFA